MRTPQVQRPVPLPGCDGRPVRHVPQPGRPVLVCPVVLLLRLGDAPVPHLARRERQRHTRRGPVLRERRSVGPATLRPSVSFPPASLPRDVAAPLRSPTRRAAIGSHRPTRPCSSATSTASSSSRPSSGSPLSERNCVSVASGFAAHARLHACDACAPCSVRSVLVAFSVEAVCTDPGSIGVPASIQTRLMYNTAFSRGLSVYDMLNQQMPGKND